MALVVAQGQIAVFGLDDGLVAAGWITLAATLTRYADRADQILATTIYPAIVRVRERGDVLEELFEKANRLTLMWAFPFGAGLALFGADLIVFVLGDEWRGAIVLLGGLAVAVALQQVGYSWFAFYRARGRVLAAGGRVRRCSARRSLLLAVPGALLGGSWGFVGGPGRAARRACCACARVYVRRLLPGVRLLRAGAAGGGAGGAGLGARAGAAVGAVGRGADAVRRRCSSWRCGSAGSRWRRTGSRAACSPSCAATCARAPGVTARHRARG